MKFAFLAFSDSNPLYLELLQLLVKSVMLFTRHHMIVYLVKTPVSLSSKYIDYTNDRLSVRHIELVSVPNIFCYKPYIILDSLRNGLQSGFYLDANGLVTPHVTAIPALTKRLTNLPISPIHPDDVTPESSWMRYLGVPNKTQHYVHGHIAFVSSNIGFVEEWLALSLRIDRPFYDETALNLMYWKYDCKNHFIPQPYIDPYYEEFYTHPESRSVAHIYHGCKNLNDQKRLLMDLESHYISPMTLKYCIVSSDDNPSYYTFYPLVKKQWASIGVQTIFVLVSENIPDSLTPYKDDIVLFKPIPTVHSAFQAQCIRVLYPSLVDVADGIITSDMDMVPLDKSYFFYPTRYKNNSFVVYRDCISDLAQYPICYCLASPSIWREINGITSIPDVTHTLIDWWESAKEDYVISGPYSRGWACDQLKLFNLVNEWKGEKHLLTDDELCFRRLDRCDGQNPAILASRFTDFHMPRPYLAHKDLIHAVLSQRKKVISFCLWGSLPIYMTGSIANAKLASKYYPDFECWFYIHKPSVPQHVSNTLQAMSNVRVIYKMDEHIKPNLFMAWRFEAIDDELVDVNMSRDVDTRILPREVLAVREWLATDSPFHIMRDSPCHYNRIMGGMFGTRKLPGLAWTKEIGEYFKANASSNDQDFLLSAVYDRVKDVAVIHDEVKKYEGDRCRSFPIPYDTSFNFVGQYVLDDDSRIDMYTDILARYVSEHMPHRVMKKVDLCIVHYTKLTDRKRLMKDQLRETCLDDICSVHWIDSFDREILTPKIVQENYLYRQELCPRPITMGEIANGMAHSHILEECSRRYEVCMVVEDDMIFTPGFTQNLFESLELAPPDWEVLAIGGAEPTNKYIGQPLSIVKSPTGFTPTGCFVIKQSLARRIVSHRLFKPFSGPIDHNLNHIFAELTPVVYWVEPFIAYEGSKTVFGTSFTDRGF